MKTIILDSKFYFFCNQFRYAIVLSKREKTVYSDIDCKLNEIPQIFIKTDNCRKAIKKWYTEINDIGIILKNTYVFLIKLKSLYFDTFNRTQARKYIEPKNVQRFRAADLNLFNLVT